MNIFQLKPKLYIGKNQINNLDHELKSQEFKNIFIVCSKKGFYSIALKELLVIIKNANIEYFIYQMINNFADAEEIYDAAELFAKKKSSLIIAVGSSSTIDFAKTLAIYVPNKSLHHSVWHYINEPAVLKSTAYSIVAIPLNWANSSCSNSLSIVYNSKMNIAQAVISTSSIPSVVIADTNYTNSLSNDQFNDTLLFSVLNAIDLILNDNEENWIWTKNYNYSSLISIIKAVITLKVNKSYEEAWNILISNSFFNGANLDKYNISFSYDLLSLFLGINGYLKNNFTSLMNELFFKYWEIKSTLDKKFLDNLVSLNKKIFNKSTSDLNLLKQFLKSKNIYKIENSIIGILNEEMANQIIQNSIIQYQKNYLDGLDINKDQYKSMQDEATVLFTKIIYSFIKN